MNVKEAIEKRRAYRSLDPVEITDEIVEELTEAARLSASCFNNQPWNFVFVRSPEMLDKMNEALSKGNDWARNASMIIAVFSKEEDDCVIRERVYNLFDTGMSVGQMVLRATEMGLVAHPIAGYSPKKTREVLGIPDEFNVITLIIVGKKADDVKPGLKEAQAEAEDERPERKAPDEFAHIDRYGGGFVG